MACVGREVMGGWKGGGCRAGPGRGEKINLEEAPGLAFSKPQWPHL